MDDLDSFWRQLGFTPGFGMSDTKRAASTTTDADIIDPALFLDPLPQHQGGISPGGYLDEVTTSPLPPSNANDITMADSLALGRGRATQRTCVHRLLQRGRRLDRGRNGNGRSRVVH